MGLALSGEHAVFASEGNSGRISLFDWSSHRRRAIDLNQGGFDDSYTGDLALDAERNVLYAVDQANFRVAVIDARSRQVLASVRVGRLPFALALSPDRRKLYVTNVGMFEYRAIPGADPQQARATGLPFPAFGFPSAEAAAGVERQTARGPVMVPGLGDPERARVEFGLRGGRLHPRRAQGGNLHPHGNSLRRTELRRQQPVGHRGRRRQGIRLQCQ